MERPDRNTLACVNAECQFFRQIGQGQLVVRQVYGRDAIRLLRWRRGGEEFSERRGTAVFHTKISEAKAREGLDHLAAGCRRRSTARLTKVCPATGARRLRVSGRHAEGVHTQHVHDLTPRALAFDEQWAYVKKSNSSVLGMSARRPETSGTSASWRLTANWWWR